MGGFKKFSHNKAFNLIANLPIGIPYCTAFRGYHLEHHKYQGVDGVDTDLPTKIEGIFFTNVFTKLFFATCQILFYAIRPMAVKQQSFIAEHYVFVGEFETYSYYGPLNALCFNVGYHNEHHDFPNIPWTRLPALKKMCPEYYDNLPYHRSWPLVIWKFIFDPNVGTFNRVKRKKAE